MELYSDLSELALRLDEAAGTAGTAATIGVFDGLHLGHQALIRRALEAARSHSLLSLVITFQEHPLSLLAPPYRPGRLLDRHRKHVLLGKMGVDLVADIPFTEEFARTPPEDFVRGALAGQCRVKHLACGYDFSFGRAGAGNVERLREWAAQTGICLDVVEPVADHGILVKSTMIRDCLLTGDVERAATLLTRPFDLAGVVRTGAGRGKGLGFPTANLELPPGRIIPARGVYLCGAQVEEKGATAGPLLPSAFPVHGAMVNIGFNPTFGGDSLSVEAHLLDFDGDLAGRTVRLHFLRRLREEQKFPGPDALVAQLQRDRDRSRQLLKEKDVRGLLETIAT